uniref:Uncharacterized protein n=1 Tax=Anguilla anguilla TaxID=7936 RepID=A0A0E9S669_ANGAN
MKLNVQGCGRRSGLQCVWGVSVPR